MKTAAYGLPFLLTGGRSIVAAMENRWNIITVLVFVLVLIGALVRIRLVAAVSTGGCAPQTGFVLVVVVDLATVLDRRETCLHVVEFGCSHNVLFAGGKDRRNLLLSLRYPVRSLGVARESLRQRTRLLLLGRLHLFEEGDERVRVVAGLVHVLHAQVIGLGFESAGELHEAQRQRQLDR